MSGKAGPYEAVKTYVHLGPDGSTVPLHVTDNFCQELTSGAFSELGPGRLVSTYQFKENWATWEKHPAGEELVVLLAGALEFILSVNGREQSISLTAPGQFFIVPRNIWHTANVRQGALALFITAGEGTENRPRA